MEDKSQSKLSIVPLTLSEANAFIGKYHRHHLPRSNGIKFSLGVASGGEIVGVAVVALPVARHVCDGWTLEVARTCTDGTPNANSALYGACWRVAKALGYRKLITYTMIEEKGTSLRAAGWKCIGICGGGTWNRPNCGRPRVDKHPLQQKLRWEVVLV